MKEPYKPYLSNEMGERGEKPPKQVDVFACDHCLLPKLKKEMKKRGLCCAVSCKNDCPWRKAEILPLIEEAQQKEYINGAKFPPQEIVDYEKIINAALPWLTKDV